MKQNITVSIEKEFIKKGKILAARRDSSISGMLADMLKSIISHADHYEAAKRHALQVLEEGLHLGGRITWTREDLYER